MTTYNHKNTLIEKLFTPLAELYPISDHQRHCPEIRDIAYLKVRVERCISSAQSGNDFLQDYREEDGRKVSV